MPKLGLTRFLKISSLPLNEQVQELEQYLHPGGYNFYRELRRLTPSIATREVTVEEAERQVRENCSNPAEVEHNLAGIRALAHWVGKRKLELVEPPKGSVTRGDITVRLEPELAFLEKGVLNVVALWNIATPELSPHIAGTGVHLLRSHFHNEMPGAEFGLLDLRRPRLNRHVPNNASLVADHLLASLDNLWQQLLANS
ncbi:hypothetical protein [Telmatospirillum sp. J64-1]|uniref:hypothetical protein n=1 Tax=Telmatospirillum sp. J64-1 TaxID=2502183 RepID=UPI00115F2871|nr:hypothetical protein [Telmatospirillum sp. J64-1]